MKNTSAVLLLVVCGMLALTGVASAWDVSYEGNVLPNDPSLGTAAWSMDAYNTSLCQVSASDGILHISDPSEDAYCYYYRSTSVSQPTAVTVEARVRIPSAQRTASWGSLARLSVASPAGGTVMSLAPDGITIGSGMSAVTYAVDLTAFHTLRLATDTQAAYRLWVDGSELGHGAASTLGGSSATVMFGAASRDNMVDSYWDYVRYSTAYEPAPEPSSFLAVCTGMIGILGGLARRRVVR